VRGFTLGFVRPRLTPAVRRLLWLALPAAVTGGITQINLLVGQIIASGQAGAIAVINYADRLNQLPLGVIGIAIGVVLLPELSRALRAGDAREAQHLQNRSLEFGLAITVPAAVGLALLPEPIIALVFERGAFTRETTLLTSSVLAAFRARPSRLCSDQDFHAGLLCARGYAHTAVGLDHFGRPQHCRKPHPVSAPGRDGDCARHQFRGLGLGAFPWPAAGFGRAVPPSARTDFEADRPGSCSRRH
jgi:hypothetical protein